jgi:hypothetical protein
MCTYIYEGKIARQGDATKMEGTYSLNLTPKFFVVLAVLIIVGFIILTGLVVVSQLVGGEVNETERFSLGLTIALELITVTGVVIVLAIRDFAKAHTTASQEEQEIVMFLQHMFQATEIEHS